VRVCVCVVARVIDSSWHLFSRITRPLTALNVYIYAENNHTHIVVSVIMQWPIIHI